MKISIYLFCLIFSLLLLLALRAREVAYTVALHALGASRGCAYGRASRSRVLLTIVLSEETEVIGRVE
jgi:hypothetical protein